MTLIVILSIVGILAIFAELVLPGGVLGVVGFLCLAGAVVATFLQFGAGAGMVALALCAVLGFVMLAWWMKHFHRLPVTRKMLLRQEVGRDEVHGQRLALVGKQGTTISDLHPSGKAVIEGSRYDVMSEGPEIARNTPVEVVEVRGPSLFVRELPAAEGEAAAGES